MSKKFVSNFEVVKNTALNNTNYEIVLKADMPLPPIKPGMFVNVEIKNSSEIFLRRPFSVFEIDYSVNTISMIVKILGRGSQKLTELKKGEIISLVYPLGNSFTLPDKNDRVLLIGGGSGVAPMLFLAKESKLDAKQIDILIGARSKEEHIDVQSYEKYGNMHFSTEDGSLGEVGFVTQHSVFKELTKYDRIYTCGPLGMMKAIARQAAIDKVFCEVSLENLMACGFGVCLCCIEPTTKGNLCVCSDGPVFNINELKW